MLLADVERYLKATRTPPTRFGRDALGDPCFVFELRDGRVPRRPTETKVLAYIASREGVWPC